MSHEVIVIGIILCMGALGGALSYSPSESGTFRLSDLCRGIGMGVAAAIIVPLFLRMISSNLLESSASGSDGYFVLAGFCLVAALSSRAFIQHVSDKVLNDLKEKADRVADKIDSVESSVRPIIERSEEPVPEAEESESEKAENASFELTDMDIRILKAMDESRYTLRTVRGIVQQLGLSENSREAIRPRMGQLKDIGLLGESPTLTPNSPKPRWYLTSRGRSVLKSRESNAEYVQ